MTNPVIECLLNHRSIRKFKPDPIDDETLNTVLAAGIRAASAGNLQQYSLIVIDDPEKKKALSAFDCPLVIVAVVDQYRFKRWLALNDAPFYNDRAVNVFIPYWDATIALQNIVVAAESLGLGTVYVGTVLSENLQEILGVPEYVFPAGMVCLGYPDQAPDLRPRLPLAAVVHRNSYHIPTDDEIRAYYREKDARWDNLPAAQREALEAQDIHNFAQMRTIGHYTEGFIKGESRAILENLAQAGFKFTTDDEPES